MHITCIRKVSLVTTIAYVITEVGVHTVESYLSHLLWASEGHQWPSLGPLAMSVIGKVYLGLDVSP